VVNKLFIADMQQQKAAFTACAACRTTPMSCRLRGTP
jgi:hypothetical protein